MPRNGDALWAWRVHVEVLLLRVQRWWLGEVQCSCEFERPSPGVMAGKVELSAQKRGTNPALSDEVRSRTRTLVRVGFVHLYWFWKRVFWVFLVPRSRELSSSWFRMLHKMRGRTFETASSCIGCRKENLPFGRFSELEGALRVSDERYAALSLSPVVSLRSHMSSSFRLLRSIMVLILRWMDDTNLFLDISCCSVVARVTVFDG